jgi:hypothetical protein
MHAMIFMGPPQALQVSISILNTRLSRCAHVIDARCWAGMTNARCLLLDANTPEFAFGYLTRSGRIDMQRLRRVSPEFVTLYGASRNA